MSPTDTGRPKDEKSATMISGVAEPSGRGPDTGSSLPMYLIMVSGAIPGAMIRVSPEGLRIGRATDNTCQIGDASVSRHHAMIAGDESGVAWATDLGSTNGTFINGRRLGALVPTRIADGDRIQIGASSVLKFVRLDPCDEQFQREMFERTVRDTLTRLYNRGYFLSRVEILAEESARRGTGLALLLLDLDHFKRINDTFGHDAGDAVLREVAGVLRSATRSEDLVARYGGEEFVAALPVPTPELAAELGERMRSQVGAHRIVVGGTRLRVTASAGLAFAPADRVTSPSALISAADQFLYQAKNSGRNRLVCRNGPSALDADWLGPNTLSYMLSYMAAT